MKEEFYMRGNDHRMLYFSAVDVLPFKARRLNFYNRKCTHIWLPVQRKRGKEYFMLVVFLLKYSAGRIRRRHTQVPDSYEFEIMVVVDKKYQSHFLRRSLLNLTAHVITIMNSVSTFTRASSFWYNTQHEKKT